MEASKGDQKVQKSTNFFFIVHGIWGAQNDRMVVGSIFGYHDYSPKCLFFYILGVKGSKKGQKRSKKTISFYFFVWGYWVCKMIARVWGVFLDIRTTRQNAYFFIFEGVWGHERVKKGQKSPKKKFFVYETWEV